MQRPRIDALITRSDPHLRIDNRVINRELIVFPVGNKNDAPDRKVVLTEDALRFAEQMGIQLFETSAKDNINVEDMFMSITRQVLRSKREMKERESANAAQDRVILGVKGNKSGKKSKCC